MVDESNTPAPAPTPTAAAPAPTPAGAPAPRNPLLDLADDQIPSEWLPHIKALRKENQGLRDRLRPIDEAESAAKVETAIKQALGEQSRQLTEQAAKERATFERMLINSELRSQAQAFGIVDLDALKLADTSTLKLDPETGQVAGISEMLTTLKATRPYLFKEVTMSTSHPGKVPKAKEPPQFNAREATEAERKARLAEINSGQR